MAIDPSGHCAGDSNDNNPFNEDGTIVYDCTVDNFERMPIDVRLAWINQFMAQSEGGKAENWFNNIQGVFMCVPYTKSDENSTIFRRDK